MLRTGADAGPQTLNTFFNIEKGARRISTDFPQRWSIGESCADSSEASSAVREDD
jgi:hypothetical protein